MDSRSTSAAGSTASAGQGAEPVVDAGQLRVAVAGDGAVVAADDGKVLRDAQAAQLGELRRAHGQPVVGGEHRVKARARIPFSREQLAHLRDVEAIGVQHERQILRRASARVCIALAVAGQLIAAGKGHGIVEVEHVLPAAGQQAADRAAHGRALVAAHGVEVLPGERAAQQHHRHLLGRAADVGVARFLALHKMRAHENQPIHALGQQKGEVFLLCLLLIARAAQQAVVAALAQAALQVVDGLGEVGVRGVRAEQADGVHGVQPQAPRKGVGRIAVFLDDAQHLLPRARADAVAAVDHAGDRGDRHARQLRDVVDVQPFRPLFSVM